MSPIVRTLQGDSRLDPEHFAQIDGDCSCGGPWPCEERSDLVRRVERVGTEDLCNDGGADPRPGGERKHEHRCVRNADHTENLHGVAIHQCGCGEGWAVQRLPDEEPHYSCTTVCNGDPGPCWAQDVAARREAQQEEQRTIPEPTPEMHYIEKVDFRPGFGNVHTSIRDEERRLLLFPSVSAVVDHCQRNGLSPILVEGAGHIDAAPFQKGFYLIRGAAIAKI